MVYCAVYRVGKGAAAEQGNEVGLYLYACLHFN
jgi:hypothetical protein